MGLKKTMTFNLSDAEMDVLEKLSVEKQTNKTAILRQALRLYQLVEKRIGSGEKLYFEDGLTKEKKELVVL